MKDLILAHDLGTTGNKASLYDASGKVFASALGEYATHYPGPNQVEQEPLDWWKAICETTQRLLSSGRVEAGRIACVTFSGQMMGCVAVDRQARPLRPAIIWADTRAVAQAERALARVGMERAYRITGHRASPSYSAAKIAWIRDHEPEIYRQSYRFLHAKDFAAARLTGRFVTDPSDASGMNLYDLERGSWSTEMLAAFELDGATLPELRPSTDVIGEVTRAAADETGLAAGTPVVIGGGDGCCAATGAGVVREGSAYNYIGASSWIAIATKKPVFDPALRTFTWAHLVPGLFSPCGTMQAAGASYQWLRETAFLQEKAAAEKDGENVYEKMNALAEGSPVGSNGVMYFPYLLGERSPRWNPDARGVYFGLSAATTRGDLARATLEGITLNLRVILDAFREQNVPIQAMRVIGGGANGKVWRQIMADIYGIPIQRPALLSEATSLGAALAGGIGVGLMRDFSVAEKLTPIVDTAYPEAERARTYAKLLGFFNRAYETFVPLYKELRGQ